MVPQFAPRVERLIGLSSYAFGPAAVSRDVREIDVNNLVDILDVIRTIMYHILHYPGDHRFWRRGEDRGGQEGLQVSHSRFYSPVRTRS